MKPVLLRPTFLRISAGFLILSTALFGGRYFPSESGDVVIPDEVIVRLKPKGNPYAVVSIIPGAQVKGSGKLDMHVLKTNGAAPAERLEALAAHPLVEFVEPNRVRKTQISAPNDPLYGDQGALNVIRAVGAWQLMPGAWSYAGTRIKVAVLDTGTDCTHPDFKGSGGSTDSATGGQLNFAKSAAPVATLATNSGCAWQDDHGHGTHVAGTIAAATQNSAGVASLGYPLEILTYKVLSSQGSGDDVTIANAITAATDAGANVVSLSLGASGYSQALQTAVDYAWARNTLVIAAAGNSGSNTLFFPASAHHAISVAATDGYTRAGFSNYGPSIAIAAPGVSILSTALRTTGYSYVRMSGTSMATPHVSALAGLIGMTTPGVATESIVQRIQQSATGNSGWTQMLGYGVINAQAAVAGTLVSSAPGSITGQVVDGSSLPVGGAVVSVAGQTFTTGAYGLFRIANIPPGSHVLTFSGPQQPSRTMNVGVAPGADTPLLLLTGVPTGLVHGIVTSAGQAVPGAVVYAMSNGLRVASTVAATDGRYQLELRTGTYEMRASAIGYRNGSPVPASVSASTEVPADLSLVRYGQIRGTARDTGGKIVSAAEAVASGPQMAGSVAAGDGTFSTIGLPAGQYTMRCSAPGYRAPDPLSISVTDGTATAADCVFAVPTITINPPTSVVNAGAQLQLTALADGIATSTVTWALDSPTGAITNTGLYTAPAASTVARTVKVTATSTQHPGQTGVATLTLPAVTQTGSATFVKVDTTTGGSWKSAYGMEGYSIANSITSYPAYVSITSTGTMPYTWSPSTADSRALQKASPAMDRIASCWNAATTMRIDLAFNDQSTHQVALYFVDWTNMNRTQTVQIVDSNDNVLDTRSLANFGAGQYLVWNLNGRVSVRFTNTNPNMNAVVSGLFFGGGSAAAGTASFVRADTSTGGSWKGIYGSEGYNIINNVVSYPSYVSVTGTGLMPYTWSPSTTDSRGLQKGSPATDRIAACWNSATSIRIDLAFNDQAPHQVAVYMVDWTNMSRTQTVQIVDANENVLDTRSVSAFSGGQYLVWNLSGRVSIRFLNTNPSINAVVSGIFF